MRESSARPATRRAQNHVWRGSARTTWFYAHSGFVEGGIPDDERLETSGPAAHAGGEFKRWFPGP